MQSTKTNYKEKSRVFVKIFSKSRFFHIFLNICFIPDKQQCISKFFHISTLRVSVHSQIFSMQYIAVVDLVPYILILQNFVVKKTCI